MLLMTLGALAAVLASAFLLAVVIPIVAESWATRPQTCSGDAETPWSQLGLTYEEAAFPSADGLTLRGWFIPAQSAHAPAIVYAHGAGRDLRSGLSIVPALHRAGYHALLFSYRDCGHSDRHGRGLTYGHGESEDVDSAVRFLLQVKGVREIGVIGYSVGATSALWSATRNPQIGAIVAVAPFKPAEIWAANRPALLPRSALAWMQRVVEWRKGISLEAIDLTRLIPRIAPRPILLIHGSHDERIPLSQVQELFAAAGKPKALWVIQGETHGSIRSHGLEMYLTDVIAFFDRAFVQASQGAGRAEVAVDHRRDASV